MTRSPGTRDGLIDLSDLLAARPARSELIYLLGSLDKQDTAENPEGSWQLYYARRISGHFQPPGRWGGHAIRRVGAQLSMDHDAGRPSGLPVSSTCCHTACIFMHRCPAPRMLAHAAYRADAGPALGGAPHRYAACGSWSWW